jgi:hypothetical protein
MHYLKSQRIVAHGSVPRRGSVAVAVALQRCRVMNAAASATLPRCKRRRRCNAAALLRCAAYGNARYGGSSVCVPSWCLAPFALSNSEHVTICTFMFLCGSLRNGKRWTFQNLTPLSLSPPSKDRAIFCHQHAVFFSSRHHQDAGSARVPQE